MLIIILMLLEVIIFWIVAIFYLIKISRFASQGIKVQQKNLRSYGHMLAIISIVLGIGPPNILGIQNDFSNNGNLIYLLTTFIGICIFFAGWQLIVTSYKPEEETPRWIKSIVSLWR